jgi:3-oxoacyl-[acyl-carrier-protein] synthase III
MKILTVQHTHPSRKVTNDDVLEYARELNKHRLDADQLASLEKRARQFLRIAGTKERYISDGTEKAIDLVLEAGRKALKDAELAPEDIEFLIYVGVGRGWVEPAMANVVQAELGLVNAACFDVMDACASWLKALQVAHSFTRSGAYKTGMIVNCEASLTGYGDFNLNKLEDLDHMFAAFTVGEASTATIIGNDDPDDDFYFNFKTFGEHFGLCMIPMENMEDFITGPKDPRYTPGKFFSLSRELITTTLDFVVDTYHNDPKLAHGNYDVIFGHAASEKACQIAARRLGLPYEKLVSTHPRFGNTVSASVPVGMSLALQEDKLHRGDKTLIIIGSAGISVGFASFTY